ncbi:MAG: hypothetical protein AAFQ89_00100 [Cyanobacteria bacterium J06626_18]
MNTEFVIPDWLIAEIDSAPHDVRQNALVYLCGILYQAGHTSENILAEILGVKQSELHQVLAEHRFIGGKASEIDCPSLSITTVRPGSGYADTSLKHDAILAGFE